MSLILNIDTASENAHVSFAKNGEVIAYLINESQKEHAVFLQSAIQQLVGSTGIHLREIDAIAVTAGPGSYTGLRVGMASAKGLCYALKKPLLTLSTLEVLSVSVIEALEHNDDTLLYCPMMDARRMEVFTAIYQKNLSVFLPPCAMLIDEASFTPELSKNKILFFGSGAPKWKMICNHKNAFFENVSILPQSMAKHSINLFLANKFADVAYSEPFYLKDFQTVTKK